VEQEVTNPCGPQLLLKDLPLVFDLDGTLIRTDTFHEMGLRLLYKKPWLLFLLPFWFLKGSPFAKARLAQETDLTPDQLPYNESVLSFAKEEAKKGRSLILATGTPQKIAQAIADYLGIFQAVIGSDDHVNMTGMNKKKALLERFGANGFDYVGDSVKDLHIWKVARRALVVQPKWGVAKHLQDLLAEAQIVHFSREKTRALAFFLALRPLFWICNLGAPRWSLFISLCFLTSGLLMCGDLITLYKERKGSFGKSIFAEGHLQLTTAFILAPLLTLSSLVLYPELWVYLPLFIATDLFTRSKPQFLRWALLGGIQLLGIHFLALHFFLI